MPESWESQDWVQAATRAGLPAQYISLYNDDLPEGERALLLCSRLADFPLMKSVKAWSERDCLLHFEVQMQRRGGRLQQALDLMQSSQCSKSVCTWRISGDLPESYYVSDGLA